MFPYRLPKPVVVGSNPIARLSLWRYNDPPAEPVTLGDELKSALAWADVLLVSDYGKGTCETVGDIICAAHGPTIVDPNPNGNWDEYGRVDCIKANYRESSAHGLPMDAERFIVTEGDRGITMDLEHFPARPSNVVDTCGAGDMVLAALGVCIGDGGMSWPDACQIANIAAGLKCERRGASPVHKAEVLADLRGNAKLLDVKTVAALTKGRRVAFTNGCFDVFHAGHVYSLKEARKRGECLVVGLNSDASVRRLKGDTRPVNKFAHRAAVLSAIEFVDYVVGFEEDTPASIIEQLKPAVLCKDHPAPVGATDAGEVVQIERIDGLSSTRILAAV